MPKDQAHKYLLSSFLQTRAKGAYQDLPIDTKDQIADALTKALEQNDFQHHPCHMCGA
jgi:hypothetical protein